jgi:flagellar hook-length control protein FliK
MDSSKSQVLSNTADIAAKAKSADVARQIENGAFKDLGQGQKQLTIRLDPQDLGQVNVILQVKGKEVQATLRTTNQETAQALNEQISQLKTQLESQGLKVTRLEVQTQLPDAQADTQWQGTDQHNRYQEQREQTLASQRLRNLGRMDVADLVQDVQNTPYREKVSLSGLDIFA